MKKFTRTLGWLLFTLRQSICWYEMNVNLVIARGLLRPFLGSEVRSGRFAPLSQMGAFPPHKIHLLLTAI